MGENLVSTENVSTSSIKTLDIVSPENESNYATLGSSGMVFKIDAESPFGETCMVAPEAFSGRHSIIWIALDAVTAYVRSLKYLLKRPNAVRDVREHHDPLLSYLCERSLSFSETCTSPPAATLNVVDKKYSQVFHEVFSLRNPEDQDDPIPTELAYWNSLKTIGSAYNILSAEHPRAAQLTNPTAVVDNSGGVRLIWKTPSKQVKANFAARPDLKSYIYYESGQVYDTEPLDANNLARRLGWLI
jgi:hypothetical protein